MVTLPNPTSLENDWTPAPYNLPDTLYDQVKSYLIKNDGGKAFSGGKSLLESEHLFHVMVHTISPNVRYLFVQGLCHPEQKLKTVIFKRLILIYYQCHFFVLHIHCVAQISVSDG